MAEWNLSTDQVTLEQKPPRRSPATWLRANSIRISLTLGALEAAIAWRAGFRLMWLVGILAVLGYLYVRRHVPLRLRRPLWMVAMSQAVAMRPSGMEVAARLGRPAPAVRPLGVSTSPGMTTLARTPRAAPSCVT